MDAAFYIKKMNIPIKHVCVKNFTPVAQADFQLNMAFN